MTSSVFDCFLFCHELDLLEVRLRVLYDHVDRFIILECNHTHMGKPKPLFFNDNKNRYVKWMDKIDHHVMRGPVSSDGQEVCDDLYSEYEMRKEIYRIAYNGRNSDEDIIMLSDIDEFPSREGIEHLKKSDLKKPTILRQDLYYYNITCPLNMKTNGTTVARFSTKLHGNRVLRNNDYADLFDDGWHFSYFMTVEEIKFKLRSFAHANTYGKKEYIKNDYVLKNIRNKTNLLGKKKGNLMPKILPEYVIREMACFPHFMGEA